VVDGQSLEELTDYSPVYHAPSVHLCRAKTITRFDDRIPWQNFLSKEFRAKLQRVGDLVAKWLACWTQVQKGPGSNRSRDDVR